MAPAVKTIHGCSLLEEAPTTFLTSESEEGRRETAVDAKNERIKTKETKGNKTHPYFVLGLFRAWFLVGEENKQ